MTALTVGGYGTVDYTADHRDMSSRVTTSGSLTLPAGTWRVIQSASDNLGGAPTVRQQDVVYATPTALALTDLDHMSIRGTGAGSVRYSIVVRQLAGSYVTRAAAHSGSIPIAARGSTHSLLIGAQVFPIVPTPPYTTLRDLTAEFNAAPSLDFVRFFLQWSAMQPSSSAWDPTLVAHYDTVMGLVAAKGWKVQLTVGSTPSWARVGGTEAAPPTSAATFAAWVDSIIDRWGGTVDIISIDPWNEPNHPDPGRYSGTRAQYVGLVRATHDGAAGRVPTAVGSLAGADWEYLADLFDNHGLTAADFDGVDHHPYTIGFEQHPTGRWLDPAYAVNDTPADRYASPACGTHMLQKVLADNGAAGKTMWLSEIGVGSNPFDADPLVRLTDRKGAAHLATMFDQLSRIPTVEAVAVHELVDRAFGSTWNNGFGLLRQDLTRRPKWTTVNAA